MVKNVYELVYMIHQGSLEATEELLCNFKPLVYGICKTVIGSVKTALFSREDLASRAKVCIVQAVNTYHEDRGSFEAYATILLKRDLIQEFRYYARGRRSMFKTEYLAANEEECYEYLPYAENENKLYEPEGYLHYSLVSEGIDAGMDTLNAYLKEALVNSLDGDSYKDTAKRLGISLRTYEYRLKKARRLVKGHLAGLI